MREARPPLIVPLQGLGHYRHTGAERETGIGVVAGVCAVVLMLS